MNLAVLMLVLNSVAWSGGVHYDARRVGVGTVGGVAIGDLDMDGHDVYNIGLLELDLGAFIHAETSYDNPGFGTYLDIYSVQGHLQVLKDIAPSFAYGRVLSAQFEAFLEAGGTKKATLQSDGIRLASDTHLRFADIASLNAVDTPGYDIGLQRASAGVLKVTDGALGGGYGDLILDALDVNVDVTMADGAFIYIDKGSFLTPSIAFVGDIDTGIDSGGDNRIDLITGTYAAFSCNTAGCWVTGHPFYNQSGPLDLCSSYVASTIVSGAGTTHACGQVEFDSQVHFESGARAVNTTFASTNIDVDNGVTLTFAANPGDASKTATGIRAVGKHIMGVTGRVTTTGTNCASIDIGDGVDVDRYGAAIAVSSGTTFDADDWTADAMEFIPTASGAGDIVVTANGGNCYDLVVKISMHYFDYTAATVN